MKKNFYGNLKKGDKLEIMLLYREKLYRTDKIEYINDFHLTQYITGCFAIADEEYQTPEVVIVLHDGKLCGFSHDRGD